jgi:hypothetical protein
MFDMINSQQRNAASAMGADSASTPTDDSFIGGALGAIRGALAVVPAMLLVFPSPKIPVPVLTIPCLYKPEKLSYSKSTNWNEVKTPKRNAPKARFKGGGPERLQLKLFLENERAGILGVQGFIFALKQLMRVPPILLDQPPLVMFVWGLTTSNMSYIQDMSYEYTLFEPGGRALVAEVSLTLVEYNIEWLAMLPQNPTSRSEPRKTWVVSEGQTLDWIAYQEYGDSAQWRHIAKDNNLANPMKLKAGQILKLTPII